jgi:hypothetical protein
MLLKELQGTFEMNLEIQNRLDQGKKESQTTNHF